MTIKKVERIRRTIQSSLIRYLFVLIVLTLCSQSATAADKLVALVVANSNYQSVPSLLNPQHDAEIAAQVFTEIGFDVHQAFDQSASNMRAQLGDFRKASDNADVAIIYYAGHGMQVNGSNYLLPIDIDGESQSSAVNSSIPMEDVLAGFAETAKTKVLVLDSCRDNPFAEKSRSIKAEPGLARTNHDQSNLMVMYAAQPGRIALDGRGENSPFTAAIQSVFGRSTQIKFNDAIIDITNYVRTATNDLQIPYIEGSLSSHIIFTRVTQPEKPSQNIQCDGTSSPIALNRLKDDFLDMPAEVNQLELTFTDEKNIKLCWDNSGVHVDGEQQVTFSCDEIQNAANQGAGYYFREPDGTQSHLWLYANKERAGAPVELGVYRSEQIVLWLDTKWPLCSQQAKAVKTKANKNAAGNSCHKDAHKVKLDELTDDFLELPADKNAIAFIQPDGKVISVCNNGNTVKVAAKKKATLKCTAMSNKNEGGVGYYYKESTGVNAHLWFYINPEKPDSPVEIGLTRNDADVLWIVTDWRICS